MVSNEQAWYEGLVSAAGFKPNQAVIATSSGGKMVNGLIAEFKDISSDSNTVDPKHRGISPYELPVKVTEWKNRIYHYRVGMIQAKDGIVVEETIAPPTKKFILDF